MAESNLLGADPRPRFFPVGNPDDLGLQPPKDRKGLSLRAWVRSLSGMQKEALVLNGATGRAWRLVSDEGPYLAGFDEAPFPLAFMATGMVASYMNAVLLLAEKRSIPVDGFRLTLDNHYTMEGSALQGTMTGGALPPRLGVELDTSADEAAVDGMVFDAVSSAPVTGLVTGTHKSRFTLTHNGVEIGPGRAQPLDRPPEPDPGGLFDLVEERPMAEAGVRRLTPADEVVGVPGGAGSSLAEHQKRMLHVHAVGTLREEGVKEIVLSLYQPIGSEFLFLSDEEGRAPDAATYLAAGIGFCFMTQFGRYAKIVRRQLDGYRVVQDLHFSATGGAADPVETHVFIDSPEDAEFARAVLDMSEQTCFLHALCRTDLFPELEVSVGPIRVNAGRATRG